MKPDAIVLPVHQHKWVKDKRRTCAPCIGMRFRDRIFKRQALGELAKENNRESVRRQTS